MQSAGKELKRRPHEAAFFVSVSKMNKKCDVRMIDRWRDDPACVWNNGE
jgi:hypothetical protein